MRPLSTTVLAAQAAATSVPAAGVTQRPALGGEDRFLLRQVHQGGDPATPTAAYVSGGVLQLVQIVGGSVLSTPFAGQPPVAGSTTTLWSTTDTVIAAASAASGASAICTTGTNRGDVNVRVAAGGAFGAAENVVLTSAPTSGGSFVACAWSNDGRLFVVLQTGTRLFVAIRAASGGYSGAFYTADDFFYSSGVACCYTTRSGAGDLMILSAATYTDPLSEIALVVLPDSLGPLTPPSGLRPHVTLLATRRSAGAGFSTLAVPGTTLGGPGIAASADTVRLAFREVYTNPNVPLTITRDFALSTLSFTALAAAQVREPWALPVSDTAPLAPLYDWTSGALWYAGAQAVYWGAAPATADLSGRLLRAERVDGESGSHCSVLLDDADGSLSGLPLDPEIIGQRLTVDYGYSTLSGRELSAAPPLWVSGAHLSARGGTRYLELLAADAWHLLDAWQPRRLYAWVPGEASILTLLHWLLARVGLSLTNPASPSALLLTAPAFAVGPGESGTRAVHALLDQVPEVLAFTAAGGVLHLPQTADPPVYQYDPSGHALLAGRLTRHAQAINHVLLFGRTPITPGSVATVPTLIADAADGAHAARLGDQPQVVRDLQVNLANAAARTAVVLRKAQLVVDAGELAASPNVGLELWDVIAVTAPDLGLAAAPYRVRELHTHLDTLADGGVYTQSVGLMPV